MNQTIGCARDAALDHQQVPFGINLDYLQSFDRDSAVAHVTAHFQAFVDLAGGGAAADGTRSPHPVGLTVRPGPAAEVPAFHHAGETAAF